MTLRTCENVGEIFETLRQRLHRDCHARQIGHVGATYPIGRMGVKRDVTFLLQTGAALVEPRLFRRIFRKIRH